MSLGESFFDDPCEPNPGTQVAEDIQDDLWQAIRQHAGTGPERTEELVEKCQIVTAGVINGQEGEQ